MQLLHSIVFSCFSVSAIFNNITLCQRQALLSETRPSTSSVKNWSSVILSAISEASNRIREYEAAEDPAEVEGGIGAVPFLKAQHGVDPGKAGPGAGEVHESPAANH